jgi:hypothetical protein
MMNRPGCLQRFGGPNKEMRNISRVDKLWAECGVGMERSGMTWANRSPSRLLVAKRKQASLKLSN